MKRFVLLVLMFTLSTLAPAQTAVQSTTLSATGTTPSIFEQGSLIGWHQIVWTTQGTVSTCSVRVDSSSDNISWNVGDVISAQTCTSNGMSTSVTAAFYNYIRVNLVTLTGGGSLIVTYGGYRSQPSLGGLLPNGLTYSGSTLTVSSANNGNGTVALSGNTSGACTLTTNATSTTLSGNCALTIGTNGGAGGVLTQNGSTSGAFTWTPSATGATDTASGPILAADGTCPGTPSYSYGTETNTGWCKNGANDFIHEIGGTPAFRFNGSNNPTFPALSALGFGSSGVTSADVAISRSAPGVLAVGTGAQGNTAGTVAAAQFTGGTKTGIFNFNQAAQSQVVNSGTEYYITRSDLDMPAVYTTPIGAGTTMRWRIALTKTAAGTGTFQILLKKGINGTTGDTSIVTQTIGTQTGVADNMECDIELTWTSATAAYWTMIPRQSAASGTGFGLVYPAAAAQFTGTISGQTTTTASDKYGLSVIFTTGTPTFVVNMVQAQAFGVN